MEYIGRAIGEDFYISHNGIKGMKWGIRRFQNQDGSLTEQGRKRYLTKSMRDTASAQASTVYKNKKVQKQINEKTQNSVKRILAQSQLIGRLSKNQKYVRYATTKDIASRTLTGVVIIKGLLNATSNVALLGAINPGLASLAIPVSILSTVAAGAIVNVGTKLVTDVIYRPDKIADEILSDQKFWNSVDKQYNRDYT